MVSLRFTLLAMTTAVLAAPTTELDLVRRDTDAVVTDLKGVHETLKAMNTAMTSFTGGFAGLQGVTLLGPQAKLEQAIKKATTTVKAEPERIPDAEASKVVDVIKILLPE